LCILLGVFSTTAFSEPLNVCTKRDADKAEDVADKAKNWDELYKSYKLYRHCDDGAIGEGFSESVTTLLANSWSKITKLNKIVQKDKGFEVFVLKHIDETVPEERLGRIATLAANECPSSTKKLCGKIYAVAHDKTMKDRR